MTEIGPPAGWAANSILVVEDDQPVREFLVDYLGRSGFHVATAADGQEGLQAFFRGHPDLVLLDLLMPKMDGWELLKRIREVSTVPVLIVSALGHEDDVVQGLRNGADDYVSKPFRPRELAMRIRSLLRRSPEGSTASSEYQDQNLHIDFLQHRVFVKGVEVKLTPTEFRLLSALVQHGGQLMSAGRLLDLCWGPGEGAVEHVRTYIRYLRHKLGDDGSSQRIVETIRDFGYRYIPAPDN